MVRAYYGQMKKRGKFRGENCGRPWEGGGKPEKDYPAEANPTVGRGEYLKSEIKKRRGELLGNL